MPMESARARRPRDNGAAAAINAAAAAPSSSSGGGGGAGIHYVMLRQRVSAKMETSGWGTVLIAVDVTLSLLSVALYIVMTYGVDAKVLYDIDLSFACFFAVNFLFWLWLAESRAAYLLSFFALVDYVTIVPAFVLYAIEGKYGAVLSGLNVLRVLRILRILRVFKMKNALRRHLEGAVVEAACRLVFTLVSILFIAAGLFYELERHGPDPELAGQLTFHESLYWASVTLTTVGYGDLSPSWWATQMMLIGLLVLTFTVLPYLTGQMMDALTSTSSYQRSRYKPSARAGGARHVVFIGALDGPTMSGLLDEFYHEDKGFNHQRAVFMSPAPPSLDVQHLLAAHPAASKIMYVQGSPFRTADLSRTCAEYAGAVFLIAPKHPEDAALADRHMLMLALQLGQYLQEAHVRLEEALKHAPNRLAHWLFHRQSAPPGSLPRVYMQIVLPEARLRLYQVLRSLQDGRAHGDDGDDGAAAGGGTAAAGERRPAAAAAAAATPYAAAAAAAEAAHTAAAAAMEQERRKSFDDGAAFDDSEDDDSDDDDNAVAGGGGAGGRGKAAATGSPAGEGAPLYVRAAVAAYEQLQQVDAQQARDGGAAAASDAAAAGAGVPSLSAVSVNTSVGAEGSGAYEGRHGARRVRAALRRARLEAARGGGGSARGGKAGVAAAAKAAAAEAAAAAAAARAQARAQAPAGVPTGTAFWRAFSRAVHVLCLTEIKHALMAHSLLGVPGVISLLSNLSTTVDFGEDVLAACDGDNAGDGSDDDGGDGDADQAAAAAAAVAGPASGGGAKAAAAAPPMKLSLRSSSGGGGVAAAASYVYRGGAPSAAAAAAAALPRWLRDYMVGASQEVYEVPRLPRVLDGATFKTAAAFVFDSCHAVLLAVEGRSGAERHVLGIGALDLVLRADMRAYIIADDVRAMVMILSAEEGDLSAWQQRRAEADARDARAAALAAFPRGDDDDDGGGGDDVGNQQRNAAAAEGASPVSSRAGSSGGAHQHQQQRSRSSHHHRGDWRDELMHSSSVEVPLQGGPAAVRRAVEAAPEEEEEAAERGSGSVSFSCAVDAAGTLPQRARAQLQQLEQQQQAEQQQEAEQQQQQLDQFAQADAARAVAAAAAVAALAQTQSVGQHDRGLSMCALAAVVHLLRSPSRALRGYGDTFMRQNYHMRPPGCVQSARDAVVEDVTLSGHVLLLGVPTSQEALVALLAPLRSRRLAAWRPVVIIDHDPPGTGGCWTTVAQLSDVYFVQIRDGLNDALLRASADAAHQAILLSPLSAREGESEDTRLASNVMTDAMVVGMYQLLKSLNPAMRVVTEMMLQQSTAYLAPTVPLRGVVRNHQHLLAPAYVSGSVFNARLLDDLTITTYCNHASSKILLMLMHQWHMGGGGVNVIGDLAATGGGGGGGGKRRGGKSAAAAASPASPLDHAAAPQPPPQEKEPPQRQGSSMMMALLSQRGSKHGIEVPRQSDASIASSGTLGGGGGGGTADSSAHNGGGAAAAVDVETGLLMGSGGSGGGGGGGGGGNDQQRGGRSVSWAPATAATGTSNNNGSNGRQAAKAPAATSAAAAAAVAAARRGLPTVLQLPADDGPPGERYGRLFHRLLRQGVLALGLYRRVTQQGLHFRATITNPHYRMRLQRGDLAFVVATLRFPPEQPGSGSAAAAAGAWPPGTRGFDRLVPPPRPGYDLLVAAIRGERERQQREQQQREERQHHQQREEEAGGGGGAAVPPRRLSASGGEHVSGAGAARSAQAGVRSFAPEPAAAASGGGAPPPLLTRPSPGQQQQQQQPQLAPAAASAEQEAPSSCDLMPAAPAASCDARAPAGAASSGAAGQGASDAGAGGVVRRLSVVKIPGLTTVRTLRRASADGGGGGGGSAD